VVTRKKGFTLVEVLVAMSVGTFVLGIAYTLMLMSGVQAKETEVDVSVRQDIRFMQEMLMYDLQYLEVNGLIEDSGKAIIQIADGSTITYSHDPVAGVITRTGADGMVRTFLDGRAGAISINMTAAPGEAQTFNVEYIAGGKAYELEITNRIRSGVRSFGYRIPPPVIDNPNYLLYIDFENGKFAWLKDQNGAVIAVPEVKEQLPDRIEIVQVSGNAMVQVNLYRGSLMISAFGYSGSLVQFNGKGSADTVPMIYAEGMTKDTVFDIRIHNRRNLSGANASVSFGYRYSGDTAQNVNELKFTDSYFDIY